MLAAQPASLLQLSLSVNATGCYCIHHDSIVPLARLHSQGAHRNGPHTPLGSSVGASQGIHDLHSELMQLLMPDGQAAS